MYVCIPIAASVGKKRFRSSEYSTTGTISTINGGVQILVLNLLLLDIVLTPPFNHKQTKIYFSSSSSSSSSSSVSRYSSFRFSFRYTENRSNRIRTIYHFDSSRYKKNK